MSFHTAIKQFQENLSLSQNDLVQTNLYRGLLNLAEGLRYLEQQHGQKLDHLQQQLRDVQYKLNL